jgi:predicted Zn-dependent protease
MQRRIAQEWPLRASSDEASRFAQNLGLRLASVSRGGGGIPWRFVLVRNLAPNAFSIGAGIIYLHEGALTFAQNEGELAAVMAHEMGHELAGHFCDRDYGESEGGWFDIFSTPEPSAYARSAGVGSLRQSIDPNKELQADRIAVFILRDAGYDPRAMLDVARRLPRDSNGAHLLDPRRVQALDHLLATLPPSLVRQRDSEGFQMIKRSLLSAIGQ